MKGMKQNLLIIAGVLLSGLGAPLPAETPNVIFILMDDMGYSDVSCYGATKVKTPNVDRMAAEGMRFTDFHTAASICSPSRAAFLTGGYPQRAGLYMGINQNREAHWFLGLHPAEITLAEQFKKQGYVTAMVGKWHLGKEEKFSYYHQGFDHYYNCENLQCVRVGDWKLHLPRSKEQFPFWSMKKQKEIIRPQLYNLATDAAEMKDVAAAHPERVGEMMALAEATRLKLGEYMKRGSEQRLTGTLFPEVPVVSNHVTDWIKLSVEEKGRARTEFKAAQNTNRERKQP